MNILFFTAHPGPVPSYWLIVHVLVIHKHWVIIKSASLSGQRNSEDKKAFQLNANYPLSNNPYFIVNNFKHVHGGGALYRRGPDPGSYTEGALAGALCRGNGTRALQSEPLSSLWTEWLTDRHHWKHHLPTTSLAGSVEIQFHNFRGACLTMPHTHNIISNVSKRIHMYWSIYCTWW